MILLEDLYPSFCAVEGWTEKNFNLITNNVKIIETICIIIARKIETIDIIIARMLITKAK